MGCVVKLDLVVGSDNAGHHVVKSGDWERTIEDGSGEVGAPE